MLDKHAPFTPEDPTFKPGELPPDPVMLRRADVVGQRLERLKAIKSIRASDMVPAETRQMYAEIWRREHLDLLHAEHMKLHRSFRMRMKRLWHGITDALFGPPPPFEAPPVHFEG